MHSIRIHYSTDYSVMTGCGRLSVLLAYLLSDAIRVAEAAAVDVRRPEATPAAPSAVEIPRLPWIQNENSEKTGVHPDAVTAVMARIRATLTLLVRPDIHALHSSQVSSRFHGKPDWRRQKDQCAATPDAEKTRA
jgi:hypothetical protein